MDNRLIPCSDGTMADPAIGCVSVPSASVGSYESITGIILNIASFLMGAISIIAIIFIIYGGICYALAIGDNDKISKSKRIIFWSIIGLSVSLLARLFIKFFLEIVT